MKTLWMIAAGCMLLVGAPNAFAQQVPPISGPGEQATGPGELPPPIDVADVDAYGEELLRGPGHEAFAEQYNQDPVAGVVVDRAPPPAVPEIPPEIRPEGDSVEWLSGYWFWDDDRDDFLWISGTWRKIPPGLRWLPGYWAEIEGGFQWVAGTWIAAERTEVEYIAQSPPESLELGPVGDAPSENHFWLPGSWTFRQNSYAWRPGFWSAGYDDWVWVPQRHLWTPRGYVACSGYWDYPLASRGTLFAPFYFNRPVYNRTGFFFTPRVSIFAGLLQSHFWVRPGYRHYYFGDYYASNYRGVGIYPWHTFHAGVRNGGGRHGYDPLFAYSSLHGRSRGANFYRQVNNQYNVFVNQADRRPARTYGEQIGRGDGGRGRDFNGRGGGDWGDLRLGESIQDVARREPSRYKRLTSDQLSRFDTDSTRTRQIGALRREAESTGRRGEDRQGGEGRQTAGRRIASDTSATVSPDRFRLPPDERVRRGAAGSQAQSRGPGRYESGRPSAEDRAGEIASPPRGTESPLATPQRREGRVDGRAEARPTRSATPTDRGRRDLRPAPSITAPAGSTPPAMRRGEGRPSVPSVIDRPDSGRRENGRREADRPSFDRPGDGRPGGVRQTSGDSPARSTGGRAGDLASGATPFSPSLAPILNSQRPTRSERPGQVERPGQARPPGRVERPGQGQRPPITAPSGAAGGVRPFAPAGVAPSRGPGFQRPSSREPSSQGASSSRERRGETPSVGPRVSPPSRSGPAIGPRGNGGRDGGGGQRGGGGSERRGRGGGPEGGKPGGDRPDRGDRSSRGPR
jgi:hypothetical protein